MAFLSPQMLRAAAAVGFPGVRFAIGDELAPGRAAWARYLAVASPAQAERLELALLRGWALRPYDLGLIPHPEPTRSA